MSHYLNKDEMLKEIIKSQEQGRCTERLGEMFMALAQGFVKHRYFNRYTYKDDLIAEGVYAMVKAFDKFDVSLGKSPLAYFTQVCYYAFRGVCIDQKKQQDIRDAIKSDAGLDVSWNYEDMLKELEAGDSDDDFED